MRVKSIHLNNFKRFTDLTISDIPPTAKLVVVIGPNGCGKSSLFDAFLHWYQGKAGFGVTDDKLYFQKDAQQPFAWNRSVEISFHENEPVMKGSLYIRTAYRNDPDFSVSGIDQPRPPSDVIRFRRIIENDQAVSDNYKRLVYDTTSAVYDPANDLKTVQTLREELIGQVRASMKRVFGELILNNISNPLGSGAFFFEKGAAKSFHYKNLSGGEKAAFDLLLDLHIKKRYFPNAVYCIDEVEAHLHTRIQGTLVREMVDIMPGSSQLWLTAHSLGVLRAAQAMEAATPGSACIIDFEGVNLDTPTELQPVALGRVSWEKLLSITLDDFSKWIAPKTVVICEGSSSGNRRKDFDAEIYSRILGTRHADIVFISGGSSEQVASTGVSVRDALCQILPAARIVPLMDRDERSPNEVKYFETKGGLVLRERNLESYLFADDVLEALVNRENKQGLLGNAKKVKADTLAGLVSKGKSADDLKAAAGEIYVGLKKLLELQRPGNNVDAFMRDTLAPLIVPGMETYQRLRADIIDRL